MRPPCGGCQSARKTAAISSKGHPLGIRTAAPFRQGLSERGVLKAFGVPPSLSAVRQAILNALAQPANTMPHFYNSIHPENPPKSR